MSEVNLKILVTNILWDTESEDIDEEDTELLPWLESSAEVHLTLPLGYTRYELEQEIEDALSDGFGFLVIEYNYSIESEEEAQ